MPYVFKISQDFSLEETKEEAFKSPRNFFSEINRRVNAHIRNQVKRMYLNEEVSYLELLSVRLRYINVQKTLYISDDFKISVITNDFFYDIRKNFHYKNSIASLTFFKPQKFFNFYTLRKHKTINRYTYVKEDTLIDKFLLIKTFRPKTRTFLKANSVILGDEVYLNEVIFSYLVDKYVMGRERNAVYRYTSVQEILEQAKEKIYKASKFEEIGKSKTFLVPITLFNKVYEDVKNLDIEISYESNQMI